MKFPEGNAKGGVFAGEDFFAEPSLPPAVGIEIGIGGGRYADGDRRREDVAENVTGAAGVEIRSDDDHSRPVPLPAKLEQVARFLERIESALFERNDGAGWNAVPFEIMLFEIAFGEIRTDFAAAGDDDRSPAGFIELRGPRGAVGVIVVATQLDDRIRRLERIAHDEPAAGGFHQGESGGEKSHKERGEEEKGDEASDDAAAFGEE